MNRYNTLDQYLDLYSTHSKEGRSTSDIFDELGINNENEQRIYINTRKDLKELSRNYTLRKKFWSYCDEVVLGGGITGWAIAAIGSSWNAAVIGVPCGILVGGYLFYRRYKNDMLDYNTRVHDIKESCLHEIKQLTEDKKIDDEIAAIRQGIISRISATFGDPQDLSDTRVIN